MNGLTTKQAADALGITEGRVRQLILRGQMVAYKHGQVWVVPASSIAARKRAMNGKKR